jgi:hypothetical protein
MRGRTSLHPNGVFEFGRPAIALVRSVPTSNRLLVASVELVVNCCPRRFAVITDGLLRYPSPPGGRTRPELSQRRNGIVVDDDDAACIMVHLDGGIRDRNNDASSLDLCILKWTTNDAQLSKSCDFSSPGNESVGMV